MVGFVFIHGVLSQWRGDITRFVLVVIACAAINGSKTQHKGGGLSTK